MEPSASDGENALTPDERADLRARAQAARTRAREWIQRAAALNQEVERQRLHHQEQVAATVGMRKDVRGAVMDFASAIRHLGVLPENAVILAKDLVEESTRGQRSRDLVELRQDVISWTIQAYFAA